MWGGGGTRGKALWYSRCSISVLCAGEDCSLTTTLIRQGDHSENANIAYLGSTVPSAQAHLLKSSLPLLGQGFTSIIGSRSLDRATQNGGQVSRVKFPNQTAREKDRAFWNLYSVLFILCTWQFIGRLGEKKFLSYFLAIKSKVFELVLPDSEMRNLQTISAMTSFSVPTGKTNKNKMRKCLHSTHQENDAYR